MSDRQRRIGPDTERQAGKYLFGDKEMTLSQSMDMRTRIKSEAMFNALTFYAILAEDFGSKTAKKIKDSIERLLIATGDPNGRFEAVEVLRQNFPKRITIPMGTDGIELREPTS